MSTRTVRLDEESEQALEQVRQQTGLSVSAALKESLLVLRDEVSRHATTTPYDVYRELDLGPGGYASTDSTQVRQGVVEAIKRKLRR
jgi:hypothetical protein